MTMMLNDPKTVTARKVHICTWCGQHIAVGDQYERATYVDGGDLWTQKAHLPCADLVLDYAQFWALDIDDSVDWSDVLSWKHDIAEQEPDLPFRIAVRHDDETWSYTEGEPIDIAAADQEPTS